MHKNLTRNNPILDYVNRYRSRKRFSFHTPGHKGSIFTGENGPIPLIDIPDDICGFPGALEESQQMAATAYWTARTYYLTNGSTAGVSAMFLSVLSPGDLVIMGRNLHMSAVSALIQTGAAGVFVPVEFDSDGIPLNVTARNIERACRRNPGARAIFITSPSYFGVCADLEAIAAIAARYRMALLLDEAWGAHLPFGSGLPPSGIRAGASMSVHGAHKTLPVLTGGALLHIADESIDPARVEQILSMVQTSSPNILFYLTLEQAIVKMKTEGSAILSKAVHSASYVRSKIKNAIPAFDAGPFDETGFLWDPVKVLIKTRPWETGITGYRLAAALTERGTAIPETADNDSVLFIFTGFEEDGAGAVLVQELLSACEELSRNNPGPLAELGIGTFMGYAPPLACSPRDAFFARGRLVELHRAGGKICKTALIPYPPGIPVFLPGEVITGEGIAYLNAVIDGGGVLRGAVFSRGEVFAEVIQG